jgi:hypothetical protein
VAGELDPQAYQESAQGAFANMAPDERAQFAGQLGGIAAMAAKRFLGGGR